MADGRSRPTPARRAIGLAAGMFVLLALQNWVGIWLNLYVTVDDTGGYGGVFAAMTGSWSGILHVFIGIAMFFNALLMVSMTWRLPDRRPRWLTVGVLVGVILAGYSGFHFVAGEGQSYSFSMEFWFGVILLLEASLVYLLARIDWSASTRTSNAAMA